MCTALTPLYGAGSSPRRYIQERFPGNCTSDEFTVIGFCPARSSSRVAAQRFGGRHMLLRRSFLQSVNRPHCSGKYLRPILHTRRQCVDSDTSVSLISINFAAVFCLCSFLRNHVRSWVDTQSSHSMACCY